MYNNFKVLHLTELFSDCNPKKGETAMSFMFNPHPYNDPNAINKINADTAITSNISVGSTACAKFVFSEIDKLVHRQGYAVIGIDGYVSAPLSEFCGAISIAASLNGKSFDIYNADMNKSEQDMDLLVADHLPSDREKDPVLLYGKIYKDGYKGLFDNEKVENTINTITKFKDGKKGVLLVYGNGVLFERLVDLFDYKLYLDMTPKRTVLNIKSGKTHNFGTAKRNTYVQMLRRAYYIDFEAACELRGDLLRNNMIDCYIAADSFEEMRLVPVDTLRQLFELMLSYPLRCRPVYIEGVWGGQYLKKIRNIPDDVKNIAWVFDMIPLEVSIVADMDGLQLEFPYFTFVQSTGKNLMGEVAYKKFGGYFPIRFNYDDTFHSSGNMSIQVHPGEDYITENYGDFGRQDESYYIVHTAQDAKTYIGFREGVDVEEFIEGIKKSENDGLPIPHDDYVYSKQSIPGQQYLLPAGTIHASGRNQVILEIGSLTVGSYTYKLYDYVRKDFDGKPRPIHSYHGNKVLDKLCSENIAEAELIPLRTLIREGDGFKEFIVGEHEKIYFSLRNVIFSEKYDDNTDDKFHVLVLVDGEKVMIKSLKAPNKYFIQNYLDMVIVPASFGEYEVINMGTGVVTIHKTILKD